MPKQSRSFLVLLALALSAFAAVSAASAPKRSKSDKDIHAIGHRTIARGPTLYLSAGEQKRGRYLSIEFERSVKLVTDPAITGYVARVMQSIAQNSDADMPIVVRVVDSDEVNACTLPGGYQYLTRGLLLKLGSEGELASVLARGIAHTALRTASKALTHSIMMQATMPRTAPPQFVTPVQAASICISSPAMFGWGLRQRDELDADYFGVQYVYKAGYAPETFAQFMQQAWGGSPSAFIPFPPLAERLTDLRKEIVQLLPSRDTAVESTSEFEEFHARLLESQNTSSTRGTPQTTLIRHDTDPQ